MSAADRFFRPKKAFKTVKKDPKQPMEIINRIKFELEKSGMEPYFIAKRAEALLARVYFPSVN